MITEASKPHPSPEPDGCATHAAWDSARLPGNSVTVAQPLLIFIMWYFPFLNGKENKNMYLS